MKKLFKWSDLLWLLFPILLLGIIIIIGYDTGGTTLQRNTHLNVFNLNRDLLYEFNTVGVQHFIKKKIV